MQEDQLAGRFDSQHSSVSASLPKPPEIVTFPTHQVFLQMGWLEMGQLRGEVLLRNQEFFNVVSGGCLKLLLWMLFILDVP